MRVALLALVLATSAFAQDVPKNDARLENGSIVLTEERGIEVAQYIKMQEAEIAELKKQIPAIPPWAIGLIVGVVAAGAGFGIGFGVASGTKK